MTPHPPWAEVYELYVLGGLAALENDECGGLAEHLASGCGHCRRELRLARARLAGLALALPAEPLSAAERRQWLARIRRQLPQARAERPFGSWAWALAAACLILAAVAVWNGWRLRQSQGQNQRLFALNRRQAGQLRRATAETLRLRYAALLAGRPHTRQVAVSTTPAAPRARAFVNRRHGVVLIVEHMAPAPPGKIYEMWLLPPHGKPLPAGIFQTSAQGLGVHTYIRSLPSVAALAVSLEPSGGRPQPTGPIVLVAKL